MTWNKTQILNFAKYIKNNKANSIVKLDDKKYKLSSVVQILCNFLIDNTKNDYPSANITPCNNPNGNTVNIKIYKKDYMDMVKRCYNYGNVHKSAPNYISHGKKIIDYRLFAYMVAKIVVWMFNNGNKYPSYVNVNSADIKSKNQQVSTSRFVSKPHLTNKYMRQDYDTSCALNILQQAFYKLTGKIVKESTMYKLGYTGSTGTGHDGIKAIVNWFNKKYGTNITIEFKNLSDMGNNSKQKWTNIGKLMSRKDTAVAYHLGYTNGGRTCSSGDNWHGHYEIADIINVATMYLRCLNSLSGGYIQDRKISVQECYMKRISQPSVIIFRKK